MIDNAAARSRGVLAAGIVGAVLAVGAVITLGLTVGTAGEAAAPYRPRAHPAPFPQRPDVSARFTDPVRAATLLRQVQATVATQLTRGARGGAGVTARVPAIGLATLSSMSATALAFVDLGPDRARYAIRLRFEGGRWLVARLTRDGEVGGRVPGTAGLADAVLTARAAAVAVLMGAPTARLATPAFRAGLARAAAAVGATGTVRVEATAVAVTTGDSATVLVAATRDGRAYRLTVTAARVGYTWLVGGLEIVT